MILKKIKLRLHHLKNKFFQNWFMPYKGLGRTDLLLFDDIYPHPISGFRHEEFTTLLKAFQKSKILLTSDSYPVIGTPRSEHLKHIVHTIKHHKELQSSFFLKKGPVNINTQLFYCVFINNIYKNLDWLTKFSIPFVFTLYPGGGFQVDDTKSDSMLQTVFSSPMFRKVIVTQNFTREYLLSKKFCKAESIEYIFGCVTPQNSIERNLTDKKTYLINKSTFDICFCASKYTPRGEDKGYDVFIDVANRITDRYTFIRFHVIGGFAEGDIDTSKIKDKIQFYGYQNFENLGKIFNNMDVIVSPNKPFILGKGAFDGFPLGTVVEAALNGVVAIVSDGLNQNTDFIDGEEILIIKSNSYELEEKIMSLADHPERLYSLQKKGMDKFRKLYSTKAQMEPRIALLQKEMI